MMWRKSSWSGAGEESSCVQVTVIDGRRKLDRLSSRVAMTGVGAATAELSRSNGAMAEMPWVMPVRSRRSPRQGPLAGAANGAALSPVVSGTRTAKLSPSQLDGLVGRVKRTGRRSPADEVRVSLNLVTELVTELAPRLRPERTESRGEAGNGAGTPARYLDVPPSRWSVATSWSGLISQVTAGGATVVVYDRAGGGSHALALVDTTSGVHVFDPGARGDLVTPVPLNPDRHESGMPALLNARALRINPDGTTADHPEQDRAGRAEGSAPVVGDIIDRWRKESDLFPRSESLGRIDDKVEELRQAREVPERPDQKEDLLSGLLRAIEEWERAGGDGVGGRGRIGRLWRYVRARLNEVRAEGLQGKVAEELGRATVGPPGNEPESGRSYEVRRYRRGDGEVESRLVVRIAWVNPEAVSAGELRAFESRVRDDVHAIWNVGARLENGDVLAVDVEFPGRADGGSTSDAHQHIRIVTGEKTRRSTSLDWWIHSPDVGIWAHEVGHHLGVSDEYRDISRARRPVYTDGSLMASLQVDDRARAQADADALTASGVRGRLYVPPRILRELSRAVESAFRGEAANTGSDAPDNGVVSEPSSGATDAVQERALFSLDVRRAALYGDRDGVGGHLPPGAGSGRPALNQLGEPNGNFTFRAEESDQRDGPVDGPARDLFHASAGVLFGGPAQPAPPRGRVMFPDHWTEDDAVYAAEQAYLHARRHGRIRSAAARTGAYRWVGEYGGVRIEGEVFSGEFVAFRPADDQSGLTVPDYVPRPPTHRGTGLGFTQRAVDVARIGDVRTRTGVHQIPRHKAMYGLRITSAKDANGIKERDNGTYRAEVSFLDPEARGGAELDGIPRRYRTHADGSRHTMFSRKWTVQEMLDAVDAAHATASQWGAVGERRRDDSYRWVGESRGVRIEGIVRAGHHVAFRPTYEQPHLHWPDERPVAITTPVTTRFTYEGESRSLDVRYALFASGQLGVELMARLAFTAAAGIGPATVERYAEAVRESATETFGRIARPDGAPLIRLSILIDEGPAHQTINVAGEPDREQLDADLPRMLGVPPDAAAMLATFHPAPRARVEELPWSGDDAQLRRALSRSRLATYLKRSSLEESEPIAGATGGEPLFPDGDGVSRTDGGRPRLDATLSGGAARVESLQPPVHGSETEGGGGESSGAQPTGGRSRSNRQRPPEYVHPPGYVPETLADYDPPIPAEGISAAAERLRVSHEDARSLARFSWFNPAVFEQVRDQLGLRDATGLVEMAEWLGRIPDDLEEIARRIPPMTARDVYEVSNEFRIDPHYLQSFTEELRVIYSRPESRPRRNRFALRSLLGISVSAPEPRNQRLNEVRTLFNEFTQPDRIANFASVAYFANVSPHELRSALRGQGRTQSSRARRTDERLTLRDLRLMPPEQVSTWVDNVLSAPRVVASARSSSSTLADSGSIAGPADVRRQDATPRIEQRAREIVHRQMAGELPASAVGEGRGAPLGKVPDDWFNDAVAQARALLSHEDGDWDTRIRWAENRIRRLVDLRRSGAGSVSGQGVAAFSGRRHVERLRPPASDAELRAAADRLGLSSTRAVVRLHRRLEVDERDLWVLADWIKRNLATISNESARIPALGTSSHDYSRHLRVFAAMAARAEVEAEDFLAVLDSIHHDEHLSLNDLRWMPSAEFVHLVRGKLDELGRPVRDFPEISASDVAWLRSRYGIEPEHLWVFEEQLRIASGLRSAGTIRDRLAQAFGNLRVRPFLAIALRAGVGGADLAAALASINVTREESVMPMLLEMAPDDVREVIRHELSRLREVAADFPGMSAVDLGHMISHSGVPLEHIRAFAHELEEIYSRGDRTDLARITSARRMFSRYRDDVQGYGRDLPGFAAMAMTLEASAAELLGVLISRGDSGGPMASASDEIAMLRDELSALRAMLEPASISYFVRISMESGIDPADLLPWRDQLHAIYERAVTPDAALSAALNMVRHSVELSWLLHGAPSEGMGRTSPTDLIDAEAYSRLAVQDVAIASAVRDFLADNSGRTARVATALPRNLPAGAWVWYSSSEATWTAVVLPGGHYRVFLGDVGTVVEMPYRQVKRDLAFDEPPGVFVISRSTSDVSAPGSHRYGPFMPVSGSDWMAGGLRETLEALENQLEGADPTLAKTQKKLRQRERLLQSLARWQTSPPLPAPASTPGEANIAPVSVDPVVLSIGVPRAGLPNLPQLMSALRDAVDEAGVQVVEDAWGDLPQRLLSNYPYLLDGPEKTGDSGLLVQLGPVELLISLSPGEPDTVANPAGSSTAPSVLSPADGDEDFRATGSINAAYATGAHAQTYAGTTSATRGVVGLMFGIGMAPQGLQVIRAGASLSGTANRSDRSATHIADAEGGHVEDNRIESTLVSFSANWSFKLRTDERRRWEGIEPRRLANAGPERLLLWLPEHYLRQAPEQVTAIAPERADPPDAATTGRSEVKTERLPETFFASGLTNLPRLFDRTVAQLQEQGVSLPIGSVIRAELMQKLWNLNTHLDKAVNDKPRGYRFQLHQWSEGPGTGTRRGSVIASVEVHAERVPDGTPRAGATSDKAHLENVRTAIDGASGGHTLANSSTLSGSVEFDLLPNPLTPDLGLGVSGYVSATWSNSDAISAGRAGLWVLVPRFTGQTAGYEARFSYTAVTRVRGGTGRPRSGRTGPVAGRALLRLPESAAFEHGFPVDKEALKEHPGERRTVPYSPEAVRGTGRRDGDPDDKTPPPQLAAGKGVGMGLVSVPESTVEQILTELKPVLREQGFLPADEDDEFAGRPWWTHGNDLDSRLDNLLLLEKLVSQRGLDSYYDQIHQDGMVFTLRRRRGFAGMDFDVDSAKITIRARPDADRKPRFLRSTDEFHTVNLAMGMDTAGQSTGGSHKVAAGLTFKSFFRFFRNGLIGVEAQRAIGGTDAINFLTNRPELLEYPGVVDEWELTSDYEVTVQFQHAGIQGDTKPGIRDPDPIPITGQTALARLLPLGTETEPGPTSAGPTPPEVLKQAVPFFADFSDMRVAAAAAIEELIGPAGTADQQLDTLAGTISLRAHLKEVLNGEYTTDQFFRPGFLPRAGFRDTLAALDISGTMGPTTFVDATKDKFVLGLIKLWLAQAFTTDVRSSGLTIEQLDAAFGGVHEHASLTGEADLNRHWGWNRSRTNGRTGGTELIQLDFNRAYLYQTTMDLTAVGRLTKDAKLLRRSSWNAKRQISDRLMMYLLAEPEALTQYADGVLPVSDVQLADALGRWAKGGETESAGADEAPLRLSGDVVARILMRWTAETPNLPASLSGPGTERDRLVRKLAELHAAGALPVVDSATRQRFNDTFHLALADRASEFRDMELPEYLTRPDRESRVLGHHGVHDLTYDSGRSTFQIVKAQIDKAAPGLLAADPEIWDGEGRVIGRLQGGIDSLQAVLARGRDQGLLEDALSPNGQKFYLVNPTGWFLSDVVEITLSDVLTSDPEVHDYKPDTGIENYGHAYEHASETRSRDGSQAFTLGRLSVTQSAGPTSDPANSPPTGSGAEGVRVAEGHHRSVTRAEQATAEQTVYDWSGHYRVRFRHELTVLTRRLDMSGRPLNNALMHWFDRWTRHSAVEAVTEPGTLELEVPRAVAEAGVSRGPAPLRNLLPLPPLPGNAYLTGTLLDDALPEGMKLLDRVFGRKAAGVATRSNLSLPTRLARTHLRNHLHKATGGNRYKLGEHLFIPGHSSDRATMWLAGDLFDLEVIAPVKEGTGTGRYAKHQSGTTASTSSDQWRPVVQGDGPTSGTLQAHVPPHRLEGSTSQSRNSSLDQAAAGTENYRREQHVKEQGPVFMVRLRGRFRLQADKYRHHLWRERTHRGTYHSDPISGDVYAVLGQSQVEEIRARLAETAEQARATAEAWPERDDAPAFELGPLLAETARANLGATRAYQGVARRLRDRVDRPRSGGRSVVLTHDAEAQAELAFRAVVPWAVRTMTAALAAARQFDPTVETPPTLAVYRRYLDMLPDLPGTLTRAVAEETAGIITEVHRVHALHPDNPNGAPAELPPEVAVLGLDPVFLARDVAHELAGYVRLDVLGPDGRVTARRWADPDGRIHVFHPLTGEAHPVRPGAAPLTFDGVALAADVAQEIGLLPARLRPDVDAFGIDPLDLGRIYRTSWLRQRTFEQALLEEIDRRRARLAELGESLVELLPRAGAAEDFWRAEGRELTAVRERVRRDLAATTSALHTQDGRLLDAYDAGADPVDAEAAVRTAEAERDRLERRLVELGEVDADLTRRLTSARDSEKRAARLAGDLRAAARDDVAARPDWDEQAARSVVDELTVGTAFTEMGPAATGSPVTPLPSPSPGLAYRIFTGETAEELERLEARLAEAGPGSVALVTTEEEPRRRLVVFNRDGQVRWADYASGVAVTRPASAGVFLALDPDGVVLDPPAELMAAGPDAAAFRGLHASALASTRRWPDAAPTPPEAQPAQASSAVAEPPQQPEYEPDGASQPGDRTEGGVAFPSTESSDLERQEAGGHGDAGEEDAGRPPARRRRDAILRRPSEGTRAVPASVGRSAARTPGTRHRPSVRMTPRYRRVPVPALAPDNARRRVAMTPAERFWALSDLPVIEAYLYEDANGGYRIDGLGIAGETLSLVAPLAAYTPLFWLARGASEHAVSVADLTPADLVEAARFLRSDRDAGEAARAARFISAHHDRSVRETTTLPERLPMGTWIWFSGPEFTGAAVVTPSGRYRIYAPRVARVGLWSPERVRAMLREGGYTFVVAEPRHAWTTVTRRLPGLAVGALGGRPRRKPVPELSEPDGAPTHRLRRKPVPELSEPVESGPSATPARESVPSGEGSTSRTRPRRVPPPRLDDAVPTETAPTEVVPTEAVPTEVVPAETGEAVSVGLPAPELIDLLLEAERTGSLDALVQATSGADPVSLGELSSSGLSVIDPSALVQSMAARGRDYDVRTLAALERVFRAEAGRSLIEAVPDLPGLWLGWRAEHLARAGERHRAVALIDRVRNRPALLAGIVRGQRLRAAGLALDLGVDFPDARALSDEVAALVRGGDTAAAAQAVSGVEHDVLSLLALAGVYHFTTRGDIFSDVPELATAVAGLPPGPAAASESGPYGDSPDAYDLPQLRRALQTTTDPDAGDIEFRIALLPTRNWFRNKALVETGHVWMEMRLPVGRPAAGARRYGRVFSVGFYPLGTPAITHSQAAVVRSPDISEVPTAMVRRTLSRTQLENGLAHIDAVAGQKYFWLGKSCVTFANDLYDAMFGGGHPFRGLASVVARAPRRHRLPAPEFPVSRVLPDPVVTTEVPFEPGQTGLNATAGQTLQEFVSTYVMLLLDNLHAGLPAPPIRIETYSPTSHGAMRTAHGRGHALAQELQKLIEAELSFWFSARTARISHSEIAIQIAPVVIAREGRDGQDTADPDRVKVKVFGFRDTPVEAAVPAAVAEPAPEAESPAADRPRVRRKPVPVVEDPDATAMRAPEAEPVSADGPRVRRKPVPAVADPAPTATRDPAAGSPVPGSPAVAASPAATPMPPWYAGRGGFGDGGVSSMAEVTRKSATAGGLDVGVDRWIGTVTAGMKVSTAGKVRARIIALLQDDDPRAWERLLGHGKLIVADGRRVKLTFSAERLLYAPPNGESAEAGYQAYFSKYGDTTYSQGESQHRRSIGSGRVEALLFIAAATHGGVSHVSPSVKVGMEQGLSTGRSIAMEVQSGNRVIANATHLFTARIRVAATVDRQPKGEVVLPGKAQLAFPTVYSSAAEEPAAQEQPGEGRHPTVRVVEPAALQGLDHAVNAVVPDGFLNALTEALEEELGLPEKAVDEIRQEIAEGYLNEKTLKDRSQWWLTGSWVSGLLTAELSRFSSFDGHLEISAQPQTVRYVTTTEQEVLIRNDIADTAMIRDGGEHESSASVTPGVALGVEIGDHLATPSAEVPKISSTRGHGRTVGVQGQAKNAIMRKDYLVRYRTEFLMTAALRSNKGDVHVTRAILGELAIGREHAREFERRALGKPTGSGLVAPEEFAVPADPAERAPALPPAAPRRRDLLQWLRDRSGGSAPPAPFRGGGVRGVDDLLLLADRGPIEIALPPGLHDGLAPSGLPWSEGWRALLLGYAGVTWVLMGEDHSTLVSRAEGSNGAPWRYVVDDHAQVVGALFMGEQGTGAREPRGYVPNPAADHGTMPAPRTAEGTGGANAGLDETLRAAGMDILADFVTAGGVPQVQLTEALRARLSEAADEAWPVRRAVAMLMATRNASVVSADGRPLADEGTVDDEARPVSPERRFVIEASGVVRGPLRPWHHVLHPREPRVLAARKGLGHGIVRETPGLDEVYGEVTAALAHQMRSAGVANTMSAARRQHLAGLLAMKFGVPGLRGAYPTLIDTGISHEERIGDHVFTVTLDAELRALRGEPVAEHGVTLDAQRKGVKAVDVGEKRGLALGGGADFHFRGKLARLFSLDVNALGLNFKRSWVHSVIDSTGAKEYRRDRTSGDVTRFEYETAYTLAVTTRRASGAVVAAQVRELSGDGYWTAVTVSDAHLPDAPVPADDLLRIGRVTVAHRALDEVGVRRLVAGPEEEAVQEFDLGRKGLSGIQVGLIGVGEISTQLAGMVAEYNGVAWAGAEADPFREVLAKIVPSGGRYGVAERILRTGTQTFLEANARTLLSKRGLPVPLPPTGDGWQQEVRIRLRTFNARHEQTVTGATLEQYTEADLRFGEEREVATDLGAAGGLGLVARIAAPAVEEGRTTSQKSSSQISAGVTGGGGVSWGRQRGELGGGMDLNLGTYSGDGEMIGADPVYTLEYRRWRRPKRSQERPKGNVLRKRRPRGTAPLSYALTRHVKIERGMEVLAPYVRAADHGLPAPARDLPVAQDERRYLDEDLASSVAYVESVDAEGVLDVIERILGRGADPELLRAVETAFSEEAVRAQYGIARRGGISQIFKLPVDLWRNRSVWEHMKMSPQTTGTVHTGIRVTAREEAVVHNRPRPDVKITTGGQAFRQRGAARSRDRSRWFSAFFHGRWATAPYGLRPAGGINVAYRYGRKFRRGSTVVARDIRRATAKDTAQEFTHEVTYQVEVVHSYSPDELTRRTRQVLHAVPTLVEVLSRGESRRMWQTLFPPGRPAAVTGQVSGRATILVPTHLTSPGPAPSGASSRGGETVRPVVTPEPAPDGTALATVLAEHVQALSAPASETLPRWAPLAAIPWRRIDQRAVAQGLEPVTEEFAPGTQDGFTLDLALGERNLRANIAGLLTGTYRIPLVNGEHLAVRLVPSRARWLARGGYTALNFPEHAAEPGVESEEYGGWSGGVAFDLGHPAGQALAEGAEQPLVDPGADGDREGRAVRDRKYATGDYVESNRQHDGDYDYYVFDAEYHISGSHGHRVAVMLPDGLKAMLPTAILKRVLNEHPDLGLERPPLGEDVLPAQWAEEGTLPAEATPRIVDLAGGAAALRAAGTLRLWTRAEHLATALTDVRRLVTGIGVPVELLVRDPDGSIGRHLVSERARTGWRDSPYCLVDEDGRRTCVSVRVVTVGHPLTLGSDNDANA